MFPATNISCVYEDNRELIDKAYYRCLIMHQSILKDAKLNIIGDHIDGKTNDDVAHVIFRNCSLDVVPKGLTQIFPNLKILSINSSELNKLSKEDLSEYKKIEGFLCENNKLEFLPGDLFDGFENLEWISFFKNKLKAIEPNIIDGLSKLKSVLFFGNVNYNRNFSIYPEHKAKNSLEEVKDELLTNFLTSDPHYIKNYLKKLQLPTQKGLISDLKAFIEDENSKDFKILIKDREFLVHKMLLAVRSPVLSEILRNNPEATNLNLVDIPVDIFEVILKFIYTDELPGENETNFVQLFVAANRLQIKELKNYASGRISSQISETNALDILSMSNKYDQDELKHKSFEKIKKKYPKIEFKDEWASNPEKVTKIIEGFIKMEQGMKKLEDEFKSLMTEN